MYQKNTPLERAPQRAGVMGKFWCKNEEQKPIIWPPHDLKRDQYHQNTHSIAFWVRKSSEMIRAAAHEKRVSVGLLTGHTNRPKKQNKQSRYQKYIINIRYKHYKKNRVEFAWNNRIGTLTRATLSRLVAAVHHRLRRKKKTSPETLVRWNQRVATPQQPEKKAR